MSPSVLLLCTLQEFITTHEAQCPMTGRSNYYSPQQIWLQIVAFHHKICLGFNRDFEM